MTDTKKRKAGRPTKYKKEYCEQLIEHMREGLSYATFAARISVNVDTLYEWEKRHVKFSDAKKRGYALCQDWWEQKCRDGAVGRIEGVNATLMVWNMKNRFPRDWRDKKEIELDGTVGITIAKDEDDL